MTHCIELPQARTKTSTQNDRQVMSRSRAAASNLLIERAEELLATEIEFISNNSFFDSDADELILTEQVSNSSKSQAAQSRARLDDESLPTDLAQICSYDILSKQEEPVLFQQMNYLKFKANQLRARIDPKNPERCLLDQIEAYLAAAKEIRDRIIQANTRLVIAVVKRYHSQLFTYEEMFSDGVLTLMSAVDKFDFDLGFRFSTYAYHSISRTFYRSIKKRQNEKKRFSFRNEEDLSDMQERCDVPELEEQSYEQQQRLLEKMLSQLDKREQVIIQGRFGLGSEKKPLTLRAIGEKLRLSKERVRQLEQKAVSKLQQFAQELKLVCPIENA